MPVRMMIVVVTSAPPSAVGSVSHLIARTVLLPIRSVMKAIAGLLFIRTLNQWWGLMVSWTMGW
jgi:hypothetical protein